MSECREVKRNQRSVALGFLLVGLALLGAQWHSHEKTRLPGKSHLGAPDALINFGEFSRQVDKDVGALGRRPIEHARRSMLFTCNSIKVARHNLRALTLDPTSEPVYYVGQTLASAYLTHNERKNLLAFGDQAMLEMLAGGGGGGEGPVSQGTKPGPQLEKKKGLGMGRWFKRMTNEHYFDVPNFPLDKQPNPDKVTHVDADLRACTDVIKEQKDCGACYAFSFVALAEWHLCMLSEGKVADLSEQYIVDCGHKTKLKGCLEGRLSNVRDFSQFFGMKYEKDQKYDAKEHSCTRDMTNKNVLRVKINDWRKVEIDREVLEKTLEEQPVVLEVHLPADFDSYSRGIHPGTNCRKDMGHGMLLVGHGRQDGVPYWLLRNSQGKGWGENGYLRISRDMPKMDECFKTGFVGKFKFAHVGEDKYTELYDSMKYVPEEAPPEEDADDKLLKWLHNQVPDPDKL